MGLQYIMQKTISYSLPRYVPQPLQLAVAIMLLYSVATHNCFLMGLRQIFIYALYFSAVKGAIKFDLLLAVVFRVYFNNNSNKSSRISVHFIFLLRLQYQFMLF